MATKIRPVSTRRGENPRIEEKQDKTTRIRPISTRRGENPRIMARVMNDETEHLYLEYNFGRYKAYDPKTGREVIKQDRRKEALNHFLWQKVGRDDDKKNHNEETLRVCEKIRWEREQELLEDKHGHRLKSRMKINLIEVLQAYEEAFSLEMRYAIRSFRRFIAESEEYSRFRNKLEPQYFSASLIADYVTYLESHCKGSGATTFYKRFKRAITRIAAKEKLDIGKAFTDEDGRTIKAKNAGEAQKEILTPEEIQRIADTQAEGIDEEVRRAFIFSCLTGLRWSDVKALTFGNIDLKSGVINFVQKKTKGRVKQEITPAVAALLGNKLGMNKQQRVFRLPATNTDGNYHLDKVVKAAGIEKHITWHCARHSFCTLSATVAAEEGIDSKTLQNCMGHKDMNMTQHYIHESDKQRKRLLEAVQGKIRIV